MENVRHGKGDDARAVLAAHHGEGLSRGGLSIRKYSSCTGVLLSDYKLDIQCRVDHVMASDLPLYPSTVDTTRGLAMS